MPDLLAHTQNMDVCESQRRLFEITMASDVINDRIGLELTEMSSAQRSAPASEAFCT